MNPSTIISLIMTILFLVGTLIFAILKEKSVFLISGFNILSKEERTSYDCKALARDQKRIFEYCTIIWITSVILCNFMTKWAFIPVFVVWLLFFLKQVHLDFDRAFEKYKK